MTKLILLFLSLFIIAGCAPTSYYHSRVKDLEASGNSRFSDVPVPAGFKFLPLDSFVSEAGDARVGILEYRGKAFPHHITKFYKNSMPMQGWQMLNIIESKESILSFEKEKEICIIKFKYTGRSGNLTISISPLTKRSSSVSDDASQND